jgi:RND family efflux transporter MFP subunit
MLKTAGLWTAALLVLAVLVAWLSGWFHAKVPAGESAVAEVAQPTGEVVAGEVVRMPQYTAAVGTVRAVYETAVGSRLLARVKALHVTAGQAVEQGQVLVELDQADVEARVSQAQANINAGQARLAQAESDLEKLERLLANKAATPREVDDARRRRDVARADLAALEQMVAEAQSQLEYATITSPIGGIVIDKAVNVGDVARPGEPLVTLYDPHQLQLIASVPERLAIAMKVGQPVAVQVEALRLRCEGTVSEIVPEASPASRSFLVKVIGPCPPGVYTGMFGRLLVPDGEREQLLLPQSAVRRVGQLEMVHVVGEGGGLRAVRTGSATQDGRVEVLSGLEAGEQVVADFAASSAASDEP